MIMRWGGVSFPLAGSEDDFLRNETHINADFQK